MRVALCALVVLRGAIHLFGFVMALGLGTEDRSSSADGRAFERLP
jgi:hypothetical protein